MRLRRSNNKQPAPDCPEGFNQHKTLTILKKESQFLLGEFFCQNTGI